MLFTDKYSSSAGPNQTPDSLFEYQVASAYGEIWLLERYKKASSTSSTLCRRMLGEFRLGRPQEIHVSIQVEADFVFAGVNKQSQRPLKLWYLEPNVSRSTNNVSPSQAYDTKFDAKTLSEKTISAINTNYVIGDKAENDLKFNSEAGTASQDSKSCNGLDSLKHFPRDMQQEILGKVKSGLLKKGSYEVSSEFSMGLCTPRVFELPKEAKLRGFGGAQKLSAESQSQSNHSSSIVSYRIACGIGLGRSHIWTLELNLENFTCKHRFEGSVNSRLPTISALEFFDNGTKLITVTYIDQIFQLWNIADLIEANRKANEDAEATGKKKKSQSFNASGKDCRVVTLSEVSELLGPNKLNRFLNKHEMYNVGRPVNILSILRETGKLKHIFPPVLENLLDNQGESVNENDNGDEDAEGEQQGVYEGELDSTGDKPSGLGIECNADTTYLGEWVDGVREGYGSLKDNETGRILYSGWWSSGQMHGYGHIITESDEYKGYFCNNKRHGYGICRFNATPPHYDQKLEKGEQYSGFWKNDKLHGIGCWTFPVGCSRGIFKDKGSQLAQFGELGCLMVHENNKILGELFFHRKDAIPLTLEDKKLFSGDGNNTTFMDENEPHSYLNLTFSSCPKVWPGCDVCWACMKSSKPGLLQCPHCYLVAHESCIRKSDNKKINYCCFDQTLMHAYDGAASNKRTDITKKEDDHADTLKWKDILSLFSARSKDAKSVKNKKKSNKKKFKRNRREQGKPADAPPSKRSISETAQMQNQLRGKRLARRLGQLLCDIQIESLAGLFQAEIKSQRLKEIKSRKQWKESSEKLHSETKQIERQVSDAQSTLAKAERNASRLQGQGIDYMSVADLTTLQNQIEKSLQRCRVEIYDMSMSSERAKVSEP